ncbi:hypothetical protein SKAU_G00032860 [Synaphobranchus kaupii]|uniref:B30.2/SPRY domain-containing protein n=1 Tax=Synaphobranchus kaupii TaxID=118154 RepID=A0A9Q1GF47_SYNKA|nr:hypothetical protein SKAU_G00032860 [Synaphobranchus kaupii]
MCKKSFPKKPELSVNRVLAEISAHFQGLGVAEAGAGPEVKPAESVGGDFAQLGEVACDSCIGRKIRARNRSARNTNASWRSTAATTMLVSALPAQRLHTAHTTSSSIDREWKRKMSHVGKRRSEVKHLIKERAKKLEEIKQSIKVIKSSAQRELEDSWKGAQELARGLEEELAQLRMRSSELDALAHTDDKLLVLQTLPSLAPPAEPMDWSGVSVNTDLFVGTVRSSVSALLEKSQDMLKRLYSKELRKLQNYASEVFLDPATAQRSLALSADGRKVWFEERQGDIQLSPDNGFWCLWLKGGQIKALSSSRLPLLVPEFPSKVGLYLDYEAGQVSFYDVKAHVHLYTFMDAFIESVFPIFSPCLAHDGKNSAPLIISPVKHS